MIRMFVRHSVKDFAKWKLAYDAFDAERKEMGVLGHAVFTVTDNPNDVTAWHDFETAQAARKFVKSPRLHEVMAAAGVTGDATIWLTEPA